MEKTNTNVVIKNLIKGSPTEAGFGPMVAATSAVKA
jgi:hypothetical protein